MLTSMGRFLSSGLNHGSNPPKTMLKPSLVKPGLNRGSSGVLVQFLNSGLCLVCWDHGLSCTRRWFFYLDNENFQCNDILALYIIEKEENWNSIPHYWPQIMYTARAPSLDSIKVPS